MITRQGEYSGLRSVVWPNFKNISSFFLNRKESINKIANIWSDVSQGVNLAFKKLDLKDLDVVTCYVHSVSCEGWFDTDSNSIHVRVSEVDSDKEILDTIIHELLHLATYEDNLEYDQREEIVEKYISKTIFANILGK